MTEAAADPAGLGPPNEAVAFCCALALYLAAATAIWDHAASAMSLRRRRRHLCVGESEEFGDRRLAGSVKVFTPNNQTGAYGGGRSNETNGQWAVEGARWLRCLPPGPDGGSCRGRRANQKAGMAHGGGEGTNGNFGAGLAPPAYCPVRVELGGGSEAHSTHSVAHAELIRAESRQSKLARDAAKRFCQKGVLRVLNLMKILSSEQGVSNASTFCMNRQRIR